MELIYSVRHPDMVRSECFSHRQDIHCVDKIKLEPARKRCQIKKPVVEVRHAFRSEAKMDDWLEFDGEESYPKPVDNTNSPFVLKQVNILGLIESVSNPKI